LLLFQEQQDRQAAGSRPAVDEDNELEENHEREERCRVATLAAFFATREVQYAAVVDTND
jgi:hypothetical protein